MSAPVLSTDGILRNFTAADMEAATGDDAGGTIARMTGLDPSSAPAGSPKLVLRVLGTGFTPENAVQFRGPEGAGDTTYVSATELTIELDPTDTEPHTSTVRVSDAAGLRFFQFTEPVPPTVTALEPNTADVGGPDLTLHVRGTGFTAATVILFNGGEEPTEYVSVTEVTTVVRPSTASGPWSVPVTVVGADPATAPHFQFTEPEGNEG